MTYFIPMPDTTMETLSLRPKLAIDGHKAIGPQGQKFITDGSFLIERTAIKRTAPLKPLIRQNGCRRTRLNYISTLISR